MKYDIRYNSKSIQNIKYIDICTGSKLQPFFIDSKLSRFPKCCCIFVQD